VKFPRQRFVDRPSDNLLRNLTLAMARRADIVVSPSAHQAEDLREAGVDGPITVVPNPIARSIRPATLLTAEQAARPRLLWVARCEPEKRPLVFAEAVLDALAKSGNAFEVDFVGDGSELAALRRITEGNDNIRVHGGLGHERVLELIDAASLVVLTSVGFDNQPMTIAEASSRFRGVLYCDPNLREGLANSGHLTATPDVAGISSSIVDLVTDPERLVALSAGAKTDSATFSAATYVERITDVYEQAAKQLTS
jgi:glycosyltransferase involved in cell wall biosynthesis